MRVCAGFWRYEGVFLGERIPGEFFFPILSITSMSHVYLLDYCAGAPFRAKQYSRNALMHH